MPDQKISQFTPGGSAQAADRFAVARAGANVYVTGTDLAAAATAVGTLTVGTWQATPVANAYIASGLDVAKLTVGSTLPANITASALTSVGTLTALSVTGNVTLGGEINRGAGNDGAFLRLDGGTGDGTAGTGASLLLRGPASLTSPGSAVLTAVGASGVVAITTNGSLRARFLATGHLDLETSLTYRIAGATVLSATALGSGVTSSSLTSVGTVTTGTWQATPIADAYLATISATGKVSNSATTATNANTPSAIVARDASGNFSAGTISAVLSGTVALPVREVYANYTATYSDSVIIAYADSGSTTITLPSAFGTAGRTFTIKRVTAAHAIVVRAAAEESIDGSGGPSGGTVTLGSQWDAVTVMSRGTTRWDVVAFFKNASTLLLEA